MTLLHFIFPVLINRLWVPVALTTKSIHLLPSQYYSTYTPQPRLHYFVLLTLSCFILFLLFLNSFTQSHLLYYCVIVVVTDYSCSIHVFIRLHLLYFEFLSLLYWFYHFFLIFLRSHLLYLVFLLSLLWHYWFLLLVLQFLRSILLLILLFLTFIVVLRLYSVDYKL